MTGKILLFLLVFTGLISAGATEKILIVTSSGKTIHPTSVTLRNDGALEYRLSGELKKSVIGNDAYLYARLPQPEEVKNADKKFKSRQWEDAAALYRKAGN
ncbi:MAG: hypothetical protein IKZ33_04765, partial [Lentisphaeria bacterium]|nr:hypothetical protein [Lentisphaeria bacterium]